MQVLFPADIQDKIVNVERVLIFMIVKGGQKKPNNFLAYCILCITINKNFKSTPTLFTFSELFFRVPFLAILEVSRMIG